MNPVPRRPPGGRSTARAPHEVRIIGGQWKRTKLPVLDRPGLRPTPDRLRETLFNWLGQDLSGWHCVDAFAGTGALGFEAASRGAAEVLLFDTEGALVDSLRETVGRLGATQMRVQRGNAITLLSGLAPGSQHVVFLDPPFDAGVSDKALAAAAPAVREGGFVYLESPTHWNEASVAVHGLQLTRHSRVGAVHGHLLVRAA